MVTGIEKVKEELESCGFEVSIIGSPKGPVAAFPYSVQSGRYQGRTFRVGVNLETSLPYPEYPPHWLHVSPPLDLAQGDGTGAIEIAQYDDGHQWMALSRPADDIWDGLRTKHMKYYIREHVQRFWHHL